MHVMTFFGSLLKSEIDDEKKRNGVVIDFFQRWFA